MGRCISWWPPHHHGESHDTKKLLSRETSRVPPQANILPLRQLDFNFSGNTSWGVINLTSFPISQSPSPLQAALTGAIWPPDPELPNLAHCCEEPRAKYRKHLFWAEPTESPTSPVWREVTSTWWRADLRAGRRGAGNLHRPLLQFSDWDPVCEPWCEHVESGAATRVSEVDPSRSSSNVPWAPYGPGPELSLHPRRSDDMFQLRTTCDTAPEDYIHLISGYSIMYFFHLQIISTFFMDAEFLQLNS